MCSQSNVCIDDDLQCDKLPHCPEGEDEENCSHYNGDYLHYLLFILKLF